MTDEGRASKPKSPFKPPARGGFSYTVSDEQLEEFAALTDLQRLTWLDEARRFTLLASTPETERLRDAFRSGSL